MFKCLRFHLKCHPPDDFEKIEHARRTEIRKKKFRLKESPFMMSEHVYSRDVCAPNHLRANDMLQVIFKEMKEQTGGGQHVVVCECVPSPIILKLRYIYRRKYCRVFAQDD